MWTSKGDRSLEGVASSRLGPPAGQLRHRLALLQPGVRFDLPIIESDRSEGSLVVDSAP
jgi:hypothetical protein